MTSTSDNSYLSSDQKAISSVFSLMTCLDRCRARLDDWNKVEFGHVGKTIVDLQKHLEWLKRTYVAEEYTVYESYSGKSKLLVRKGGCNVVAKISH